jgi:hypothetical protein
MIGSLMASYLLGADAADELSVWIHLVKPQDTDEAAQTDGERFHGDLFITRSGWPINRMFVYDEKTTSMES